MLNGNMCQNIGHRKRLHSLFLISYVLSQKRIPTVKRVLLMYEKRRTQYDRLKEKGEKITYSTRRLVREKTKKKNMETSLEF